MKASGPGELSESRLKRRLGWPSPRLRGGHGPAAPARPRRVGAKERPEPPPSARLFSLQAASDPLAAFEVGLASALFACAAGQGRGGLIDAAAGEAPSLYCPEG